MSYQIHLPEKIDSHWNRACLKALAQAVAEKTKYSEREAAERICRLLGYLCKED